MPDPRFHAIGPALPLSDVLRLVAGRTAAAPDRLIRAVAALGAATADQIAYLDLARHLPALAATSAGACLVPQPLLAQAEQAVAGKDTCLVIVSDPKRAFLTLAAHLHREPTKPAGIDPTARVDPTAQIDPTASIGPGAILGAGVTVGPRSAIAAHAVIGPGVQIGADCQIHPHVTLSHALLGDRVTVFAQTCIGRAGFGFHPGPGGLDRIPQLGRVILHDDVEVGAQCCIDRGALEDTIIGRGTKIDNLVQIAHNCRIGAHCVITGQCGLAGSVVLEDGVMLGGQVGIADHVTIGRGAKIAAKAGVFRDVPAGEVQSGIPARPAALHFKAIARDMRLGRSPKP